MTPLHRVLYCSRNRIPGNAEAASQHLRRILATSRRRNATCDVTGALLFSENCFAQVLEGPATSVEETFERIQCDERHGEVVVLQSSPIDTRDFPDWSMAFAGPRETCSVLADLGVSAVGLSASMEERGGAAAVHVLALLRAVVVRDTGWLAPPLLSLVPPPVCLDA